MRCTTTPRMLLLLATFAAACTASPASSPEPSGTIASPIGAQTAIPSPSPSLAPSPLASAGSSPGIDFDWSLMPTAIDFGNGTRFGVVADQENQWFGRFGFAKIGDGIFWADGATVTPSADGRIRVVYHGPGTKDPDAKVELLLGLHEYSETKEPVELNLEMDLPDQDVAAEHGLGHGWLIADGVRYSVGTDGQAPPPDDAVDQALALLRASDWRAFHATFASWFQALVSESTFESEMRKGSAVTGRIVDVSAAGPITTYDKLAGLAAYVNLEITVDKGGVITMYPSRLDLVYGDGRWQVLTISQIGRTAEPSP